MPTHAAANEQIKQLFVPRNRDTERMEIGVPEHGNP